MPMVNDTRILSAIPIPNISVFWCSRWCVSVTNEGRIYLQTHWTHCLTSNKVVCVFLWLKLSYFHYFFSFRFHYLVFKKWAVSFVFNFIGVVYFFFMKSIFQSTDKKVIGEFDICGFINNQVTIFFSFHAFMYRLFRDVS